MSFQELRREYTRAGLDESNAAHDPFEQFTAWFDAAVSAGVPLANTMLLATADRHARPSVRAVLMKGYGNDGFVFYTDYGSRKAREMTDNPQVSALFWWEPLERQVRIEGRVQRTSDRESDDYFHSRPLGSRLGALASPQSEVIANRGILEARVQEMRRRHGEQPPRPPGWGGFRLVPSAFEFWQGRADRLHDRLFYNIDSEGVWSLFRLAP